MLLSFLVLFFYEVFNPGAVALGLGAILGPQPQSQEPRGFRHGWRKPSARE